MKLSYKNETLKWLEIKKEKQTPIIYKNNWEADKPQDGVVSFKQNGYKIFWFQLHL